MNVSQEIDHLLIIGNGFDINLGFKTRYRDFMEDNLYTNLLKKK